MGRPLEVINPYLGSLPSILSLLGLAGSSGMDHLANYPAEDRQVYFEQAVARLGRLTPQLIEKDFWVCWILKRLFELDEVGMHLTFKGGTSLSKVFKLIERFSEDVDLAIERSWLGFGGDQEPEAGASGKEQQRRVERLKGAAQELIADRILPDLRSLIGRHLLQGQDWDLSLSPDDSERQTILFRFPSLIRGTRNPYIAPSVKLELGARSDHFPVGEATITSYLHEALPDVCSDPVVRLRVLGAERTFWEKATILHSLYHQPAGKPFQLRLSRHYYDLYQLAESPVEKQARSRLELLDRVATHKQIFFKSSSARYSEAKPGSLRLVPPQERISELQNDYQSMQPMFFGQSPSFDRIISRLSELETSINQST